MIRNKKELREYLDADWQVIGFLGKRSINWKYMKILRKTEYYENTGRRIRGRIYHHILNVLQVYTGVSIKPNNFGKGLGLIHTGSIVVNSSARFGDWCVIQNNVNVAANVSGGGGTFIFLKLRMYDVLLFLVNLRQRFIKILRH